MHLIHYLVHARLVCTFSTFILGVRWKIWQTAWNVPYIQFWEQDSRKLQWRCLWHQLWNEGHFSLARLQGKQRVEIVRIKTNHPPQDINVLQITTKDQWCIGWNSQVLKVSVAPSLSTLPFSECSVAVYCVSGWRFRSVYCVRRLGRCNCLGFDPSTVRKSL